jgi:CheY-like chemotaxis protein
MTVTPELDVLVVEDEPDVRTTLSDLIGAFGYQSAEAANGVEALHALRRSRPRLVLLDLMMPVMDGWEFCSELENDAALREQPIAIITGFELPRGTSLPPRVIDAGVFKKPIDMMRLKETLHAYCGARPGPEPLAVPALDEAPAPAATGHEILVVEDDTDLRQTLASILELEGYRVRAAGDGREALGMLRGGYRPSLLLVDLIMPVMDGWELCDALSTEPGFRTVPVILMSASGGPLPPPHPSRLVRLFKKPFTFSQLLDAIAKGCGGAPEAPLGAT